MTKTPYAEACLFLKQTDLWELTLKCLVWRAKSKIKLWGLYSECKRKKKKRFCFASTGRFYTVQTALQGCIFCSGLNYVLRMMIILHCTYRSFNHEIGITLVIIKSMYLLLCLNILFWPVIKLCSIRTWIFYWF